MTRRIRSREERERPVNEWKVPRKMWDKWTILGRAVFNKTYASSIANPEHYTHPKGVVILEEHWKTIAWNHAFMAASIASRGQLVFVDIIKEELIGK